MNIKPKKLNIAGFLLWPVFFLAAACGRSESGPVDAVNEGDAAGEPRDMTEGGGDCPAGLAECGGNCIDLSANHSHCGSCGNECEPFEACSGGACVLECPPGEIVCEGACVDISSDIMNCGGCGVVCMAGANADPLCDNRVCTVRCHEGWSDPDGDGSCDSDCVPSAEGETCNGVDDDCDGDMDEDFDCTMGREVACTTDCGGVGTGTCGLDCEIPAASACHAPDELCNGRDDDCDGTCDNGFDCCRGELENCTTSCGSTGHRQCWAACTWSDCVPPVEWCNGEDDDCSGACDDGAGMECCLGETQADDCGSCGTRARACEAGCTWGAWGACSGGDCEPGEDQQQPCEGGCGNRVRVCEDDCAWGEWSSCDADTVAISMTAYDDHEQSTSDCDVIDIFFDYPSSGFAHTCPAARCRWYADTKRVRAYFKSAADCESYASGPQVGRGSCSTASIGDQSVTCCAD